MPFMWFWLLLVCVCVFLAYCVGCMCVCYVSVHMWVGCRLQIWTPSSCKGSCVCRWSQLETSWNVMVFHGAVEERLAALLYLQHADV